MHRDRLPIFAPHGVPARVSARFTYLAEAIARAYEPTPTELFNLERAYNSTGEYMTECAEFDGLLTQVHAHGSRQLGTIVRPVDRDREGFDIDLVVRLERAALARYGSRSGPTQLLEDLHTVLKRYANQHGLGLQRWERCVTLKYAGGMFADFAPVIDDPQFNVQWGEHHGRIPDRELKTYASTNPRGYSLAFDTTAKIAPVFRQPKDLATAYNEIRSSADVVPLPAADDIFGRVLSRVVQLAKVHRNVAFSSPTLHGLKPPSVFITTLLAEAYATEAPKPHDGPFDLMLDMMELMPSLFDRTRLPGGREHWSFMNPTAQGDNLAASMNTAERQQAFLQWQRQVVADLQSISDAIEQHAGLDEIVKLLERAFGPRASQAVQQLGAHRRDSNRALGRAGFFIGTGTSVVTPAAAHTFFGR